MPSRISQKNFSPNDAPVCAEQGMPVLEHHQHVAKTCWPNGCWLVCQHCPIASQATVEQVATYLAKGWPTCCGLPMQIGDKPENRN